MSLVHSAKINGHDPYAYLKDVLERLPTHPASRVEELLPHRWKPSTALRSGESPASRRLCLTLTQSGRFDVVFETFGKLDSRAVGTLRRRGCFVSTAMTAGRVLPDVLLRFGAQQERCISVRAQRADLAQVALWLGSGQLSTLVSARFPLESFPDAFPLLESGLAHGKVVIDIVAVLPP